MTKYHLEYFRPVRHFPGEILTVYDFRAASDVEAADKIVDYVGRRARRIRANGTIRYVRVSVCLNRSSGRQIPIPWERLHALPTTRDQIAS